MLVMKGHRATPDSPVSNNGRGLKLEVVRGSDDAEVGFAR